jgi:hypothetical protein
MNYIKAEEKDNFRDVVIDECIKLKYILGKLDVRIWIGLGWLKIVISGSIVWER